MDSFVAAMGGKRPLASVQKPHPHASTYGNAAKIATNDTKANTPGHLFMMLDNHAAARSAVTTAKGPTKHMLICWMLGWPLTSRPAKSERTV